MEVVAYDSETVTIKMNRKKEFLRLYKIVPCVAQEYRKIDNVILGLTKDEVGEMSNAVDGVMKVLHGG